MSIRCSPLSSTAYCLLLGFTKLPTMSSLLLSILCVIARAIIQNLFSGFFFLCVRTARSFNWVYKAHAFSYMFICYIFFLQTFLQSRFHVLVKQKSFPLKALLFLIVSAWTTFSSWFYAGVVLSYPSAQDFTVKFPASHSWLFSFSIFYMYPCDWSAEYLPQSIMMTVYMNCSQSPPSRT